MTVVSTQKKSVYKADQLETVLDEIKADFREKGFLRLQWSDSKPRSLDQNALAHAWYHEISRTLGEDTPEGVKCECKLRFGVPILRAEDPDFIGFYDRAIKHNLTYEEKLKAMRYLPVTSLMDTQQLSQYLLDIQQSYVGRVDLRFPDEYPE